MTKIDMFIIASVLFAIVAASDRPDAVNEETLNKGKNSRLKLKKKD